MKLRKALIPVAAAAGAALAEVYKYTFCRNGSRILNPIMDKRTHSADYYAHRDGAAQALREAPQLRFAMRSERGELLRITFLNISRDALNIPAEELMERFVRGDASRSTEGSGLGLSIARSLTELQGGTFTIAIEGDLFKASVELPLTEE